MSRDQLQNPVHEQDLFRRRAFIAATVVATLVAVLIGRLTQLQILSHEHFNSLSENNRVRIQPIAPTRGLIYDRDGVLLADNLPSYRLEIIPEEVDDLDRTLAEVGELIPVEDIQLERFERLRRHAPPYQGTPLRLNLDDAEMARVAVNLHQLPGVYLTAALTRHYPLGSRAVHVLGYVGRISEEELKSIDVAQYRGTTHIGKTGIEWAYEELLHGEVGYQQVETNAQGRTLRVLSQTAPKPGHDLHLTVDIELQKVAEDALGESNGAIVALDPRSGEVLALASQPRYDPNLFVTGIDHETYRRLNTSPDRPLFNRALHGAYPPGSTLKPLVGLAGLHHGVVNAGSSVFCPGFYRLPNTTRKFRDWKRWGHGHTDLDKSIVESCDVFYYDLAKNLGIERMHDFLARFGLGSRTGVDIGRERTGVLPNAQWKRANYNQPWYTGETLIAGIGQGFMLTTPLQLAQSTALLGSRGVGFRPRALGSYKGIGREDRIAVQATPVAPIDLETPRHWEEIILAMTRVVHSAKGTARRISTDFPYRIAGKTGTAQVFSLGQDEEYDAEKLEKKLRDHAVFVAFTPAEAPRIALSVIVENGGGGGSVAAPVARTVLDAWVRLVDGGSTDSSVAQAQENPLAEPGPEPL
jgi:penicillin-binding protein 2